MRKYDVIHNHLQAQLFRGEITLEAAERVDKLAYKRYGDDLFVEAGKDTDTVEMLEAITKAVDDGKLKLDKDQKKFVKELFDSLDTESKEDEDTDDNDKDDADDTDDKDDTDDDK